ncbi:MAG: hypothetical protein M5R36_12185 [Deltaproteobacteria bacterium]|nr:hypothetical protein [Deltaproteobacteria bacterium]
MFAMWLLGALAFFAFERENENAFPVSGLFFFFAAVTRPEGAVYGGLAGLWIIFTEIIPRRKLTKRQVLFAALFLIPFGVYQVIRYIYFAWPLPMTFYAKTSERNVDDLTNFTSRGWRYIIEYVKIYRYLPLLVLAPFAAMTKALARGEPRRGVPGVRHVLSGISFARRLDGRNTGSRRR